MHGNFNDNLSYIQEYFLYIYFDLKNKYRKIILNQHLLSHIETSNLIVKKTLVFSILI